MARDKNGPAWLISDFRLTGFLTPGVAPPLAELFAEISGSEADLDQTNRQEGSRTLSGRFAEAAFQLVAQSQRMDGLLRPGDQVVGAFPSIAPLAEGRESLRRFYTSFIQRFNAFNRLACAGTYILGQPDLISAYTKLAEYLPSVKIDPKTSLDLLYRINRPRIISISDRSTLVNRLCTWSAATLQTVSISVGAIQQHGSAVSYAVQVQTDVNTAPNVDILEFELESKLRLIESLEDMSAELAIKGDVP